MSIKSFLRVGALVSVFALNAVLWSPSESSAVSMIGECDLIKCDCYAVEPAGGQCNPESGQEYEECYAYYGQQWAEAC